MSNNVVGIHQPNYLPWVGYFSKIRQADTFIFLDDCEFSKNGYFNRVELKGPNGKFWLTAPIHSKKNPTENNSVYYIISSEPVLKVISSP